MKKKFLYLIVLFLFISVNLQAKNLYDLFLQAQQYVKANDTPNALSTYNEMIKKIEGDKQKSFCFRYILNNIANIIDKNYWTTLKNRNFVELSKAEAIFVTFSTCGILYQESVEKTKNKWQILLPKFVNKTLAKKTDEPHLSETESYINYMIDLLNITTEEERNIRKIENSSFFKSLLKKYEGMSVEREIYYDLMICETNGIFCDPANKDVYKKNIENYLEIYLKKFNDSLAKIIGKDFEAYINNNSTEEAAAQQQRRDLINKGLIFLDIEK